MITCAHCRRMITDEHSILSHTECPHHTCLRCCGMILDIYQRRCRDQFIQMPIKIDCPECYVDISQTLEAYMTIMGVYPKYRKKHKMKK